MLKKITFMSLSCFKKIIPDKNTSVISILDRSEQSNKPSFNGFKSVLELDFEDISEEWLDFKASELADEPSEKDFWMFKTNKGERPPALSDATQIFSFIKGLHLEKDEITLIVHCFAGISRSAAVAYWASVRFFVPVEIQENHSIEFFNRRLFRLLEIVSNAELKKLTIN